MRPLTSVFVRPTLWIGVVAVRIICAAVRPLIP